MRGLRRAHVKSRHGCTQCKNRRIKCDERPPVCGNCTRRRIKCDYESYSNTESPSAQKIPDVHAENLNIIFEFDHLPIPSAVSRNRTQPPTASQEELEDAEETSIVRLCSANSVTRLTRPPSQLSVSDMPHEDMELLHCFLTGTAFTIAFDNTALQFWQHIPHSVARTHDYAMHTLLAFSALHIAHMRPQNFQKYLVMASGHQWKAITSFKESVQVVSQDNHDAIFIFSTLLVLTELGLMHPSWDRCNTDVNPIDQLVQQLMVIRNVLELWHNVPWLRSGSMVRQLLGHSSHEYRWITLEAYAALSQLEDLNQRTITDLDEQMAYSQSIHVLCSCYYLATTRPKDWFPTLRWAKGISPKFGALLRARRPLALLILAQYCVLVHRANPVHWWLRGWSEQVFDLVTHLLDKEWMPYLSWAMGAMKPDQQAWYIADAEPDAEPDIVTT